MKGRTFKCANGRCIDPKLDSCPLNPQCPSPFEYKCPNGLCVTQVGECPNTITNDDTCNEILKFLISNSS